ncbi:MAG: exonuclease SbcCD subunit D [Anaerolineae bacterium]|nr:exonuclease SbcCD subunit D [Anaerolineae bacterium]NUQ05626.1 exonuclease SbcCD subunit D [Anaerolineae bacterium]
MSESIRVLHFADVHIGVENYGGTDPETGLSQRVRDFLRRMDEMIEYARAHDVDLTIFAGDAFKTRTPNPTFQREFAWRILDLAALAPVVMLVGNHDLPPTLMKASSVEIYRVLNVPNVWVADSFDDDEGLKVVTTKRGDVVVGTAPYPIRSRLLDGVQTGGLTVAQTDVYMLRELIAYLERLADKAATFDCPRILTGHLAVDGAHEGSERLIKFGRDVTVPYSAVGDPRWDYVALGHIHQYQDLSAGRENRPPVIYSGSLERIDFGEEHEAKGFCWVELGRGSTTYQFRRVKARPFKTIRLDLRQSLDPTVEAVEAVEAENLREAVVRVILALTPETDAKLKLSMVRDALIRGGTSYIAGIRREVEQPARARLGANPEALTDIELVERYFISKDTDSARRTALLEAAEALFQTDEADDHL